MAADAIDVLKDVLGPQATASSVVHGVAVFEIAPTTLTGFVERLKRDFGFDIFLDVTAVDWLPATPRFEIVWHFYSTAHKIRVRLKARVPENASVVDSLVGLYGSARFMERECHDMYGIGFRGNADLRPILLYEGFEGHPLRKDYDKAREQPLVPYRT